MKPDKRNQILDAARKRFFHYGVKKTTMEEIAKDAGVAVGTLYLYFKDKDMIVEGCVDRFISKHGDEEKKILNSKVSTEKKLINYMVARFRASKETRTGTSHAAEMTKKVLTLRPNRLKEEGDQMVRVISSILSDGCQRREFNITDIDETVFVFLHAIGWFFPLATDEFREEPDEKAFLKVIRWFIKQWKI